MLAVGLGLHENTFMDAGKYGWISYLPLVRVQLIGTGLISSPRQLRTWTGGVSLTSKLTCAARSEMD